MANVVTSTFDKSAQMWTLEGDVASSGWEKTGGDPGGYLGWVDAASGVDSYYVAPKAFLGEKGAYVGGTLAYSILDSGNGYTAYDVQLVGAGNTLQYTNPNDGSFPTPGTWTDASVVLKAGNFVDTSTGRAPSFAEFRAVLKDLTSLDIRAEYVTGNETGGLDNVTLTPATMVADASGGRAHLASLDLHHGAQTAFTLLTHTS